MRISTSAIYDVNISNLNMQQAKLLHTQQTLASGRRMLTPADDPAATARALELTQADSSNTQYASNRNSAMSISSISESVLQNVSSLLQDIRTTAVQAGGGTMSVTDRRTLASALSGQLEELQALANSTDGIGNYLFSGYQGKTQPFINAVGGVQYLGDDGQRKLQISSSRQMATTDSGADIFMRVKNGNGTFIVQPDPTSNLGAGNTGTGIVSQGLVTNQGLLTGNNYTVSFSTILVGPSLVPTKVYNVFNNTTGLPVPPGPPANTPYVSGQAISFDGMQIEVTGLPADGDAFTLAPSTNESIFKTVSDLITTMGLSGANFTNNLNRGLNKLDSDLNTVLTVRGSLGSRMSELDTLQSIGEDLGLNYKTTLSQLQDVDYNKGISDMNQQQLSLQAAQKTFKQISDMSLFNYI
ncbi:MAG TPA: flagellar hook-associated protein FlgL [Gallionellaceae bacterium]|nr:flagellar hook-associated protein FlgL [Gallionellaceae bacterium]